MKTPKEKYATTPPTCANGKCDIGTQRNVLNPSYKLKCSECDFIASQPENIMPHILCPKCNKGILYWSYEPDDGLTDYQRRMIRKFYGNLTDTKIILPKMQFSIWNKPRRKPK